MKPPAKDPEAQNQSGNLKVAIEPTVTIHEDPRIKRTGTALNRQLHRTLSRRETIEPAVRYPAEFHTLSIHVETKASSGHSHSGVAEKRKGAVKELANLDWHKISGDEALQRLSVSPKTGLDSAQAQRRLVANGKNAITAAPNRFIWKILGWIFGGFGSLLLTASVVCFIAWKPLGNPNPQASNLALAVVLLIVVFFQALFNAWQDFSTSRVMKSIKGMLPSAVAVLRDGQQVTVPAIDLVTGDLVLVGMGQKIPADLRLLEVSGDLKFDRSILTGESEPVAGRLDKTDDNFLETKNIALQGTHCVSGSGMGLVIQTGDLTVFGRIAKLSSISSSQLTTLQREILRLVVIIASLASAVAIIIVILWAAWLRRKFPSYINVPGLLIDVVSVMVAFIPEGLPVAVTVSLAKVAHTLSKHKVLCKSLSIVETLGSVNVLCSDKTGTLTQNKMTVEDIAVFDTQFTTSSYRESLHSACPDMKENLAQVASVSAICNAAVFEYPTGEKGEKGISGDATDTAILRFADIMDSADSSRMAWTEVFKMNFNSKTKFMLKLSALSRHVPTGTFPAPIASWDQFTSDSYLLTVKGAPEILLPRCDYVVNPQGGPPLPLTSAVRTQLTAVQEQWAAQGRRVLILSKRVIRAEDIPKKVDKSSDEFAELVNELNYELVIVGLVGLIDPLKPDIIDTVSKCRGAGIRFFVVTGDHPTTAVAIASQAGIISNVKAVHHFSDLDPNMPMGAIKQYDMYSEDTPKGIVITGPELQTITQVQMEQLAQYDEIVFSRTTPEQKLRIVNEFKGRSNIVAMTGDGVNDAPSLKAADIGIAMGDGSDVAREAADMVLMEDFSAIVIALEYGRLVYDNLKKTVLYLLPAGSFSELMPIILNVLIGVPQMLSNIQMILICVATDVLPGLSMCLEKPEFGLLKRKPRDVKKDRLVDWKLLLHAYGFVGVLESLCAMSMSFWYLHRHGVPFSSLALRYGNWPLLTNDLLFEAQSVYFFTLIIMQWGNLFATRGRRFSIFQHTPASNWYVFPAAAMALVIGIFFSYIPWFQNVFQTRGIPVEYFFIPLTFGLALLFLDESRKFFVRKYPNGILARLAW
ncbi:sodium-potassium ATPase [Rickenella mellea]|uniref:Sodium-potassium ATPase n=1 Tax=Rickenella mellea TaxID=50990 RepID=A0A4Y7PRL1_9AGAM|nr:sodium-potassium ATPase [Rickenella mellea]